MAWLRLIIAPSRAAARCHGFIFLSKMEKVIKIVISVLICALFFVSGVRHGRVGSSAISILSQTDTIIVRDTIIIDKPVYLTETFVDTVRISVSKCDTVEVHDTVYLPITQRHYSDDRYDAWVSGYQPRLDSIRVYPETRHVTQVIRHKSPPRRWGIGVQAGYGISLNAGQLQMCPYIGVGISYNIVRF